MITRVSSATQRWLVIRSDDMSSCSCMQLVSHMFAPRLQWPRERDPDECNLQVRFATCSLAFIGVFLLWQIPRNIIATPSLLGRSQTAQVRSLCVAQVGAHVRARASSQYACALHSTTFPRIASCSHSALQLVCARKRRC